MIGTESVQKSVANNLNDLYKDLEGLRVSSKRQEVDYQTCVWAKKITKKLPLGPSDCKHHRNNKVVRAQYFHKGKDEGR